MAVVVALSAGGIGFMLVVLRALLHEPKKKQPYYALLLQEPRPAESEPRSAIAGGLH